MFIQNFETPIATYQTSNTTVKITTEAAGEEGINYSTPMVNGHIGSDFQNLDLDALLNSLYQDTGASTRALGEEGGGDDYTFTTQAMGEEGGGHHYQPPFPPYPPIDPYPPIHPPYHSGISTDNAHHILEIAEALSPDDYGPYGGRGATEVTRDELVGAIEHLQQNPYGYELLEDAKFMLRNFDELANPNPRYTFDYRPTDYSISHKDVSQVSQRDGNPYDVSSYDVNDHYSPPYFPPHYPDHSEPDLIDQLQDMLDQLKKNEPEPPPPGNVVLS